MKALPSLRQNWANSHQNWANSHRSQIGLTLCEGNVCLKLEPFSSLVPLSRATNTHAAPPILAYYSTLFNYSTLITIQHYSTIELFTIQHYLGKTARRTTCRKCKKLMLFWKALSCIYEHNVHTHFIFNDIVRLLLGGNVLSTEVHSSNCASYGISRHL